MTSLLFVISLARLATSAQAPARPVISLWPNGNPGGWTRTDKETTEYSAGGDFLLVKSVSSPTLEIFRAKGAKAGAPTAIICPGGGYSVEAIEHEGWELALRLNLAGIHAAVLKYRLPEPKNDKPIFKVALQDAQRAIRLLRSRAKEFGFTPDRIGMLGFSAGGHATALTSTAPDATYPVQDAADKLNPRPDFTGLIYPAYLNIEGTIQLTPEIVVDKNTPPVFVVQAMDDPLPIEGAMAYVHACHLAKVPAELHLFPKGGHGYGLRTREPGLQSWPDLLISWINRMYP